MAAQMPETMNAIWIRFATWTPDTSAVRRLTPIANNSRPSTVRVSMRWRKTPTASVTHSEFGMP